MNNTATNYPVLVTGATGFIASHIINQLLLRGYKVRGTVRKGKIAAGECAYLFKLPQADINLELVEVDLRDEIYPAVFSQHNANDSVEGNLKHDNNDGSGNYSNATTDTTTIECSTDATKRGWLAAFSGGVEFVLHCASPYVLCPDHPEVDLMEPAMGGTQKILELCQQTDSVKRLVFTSCMSAISDEFDNSKEYDERDWNTMSSLSRNSYAFSKTSAEMTALNFSRRPECSFQLVCLLPSTVWGPPLSPIGRLSQSHRYLLNFLNKQIPVVLNISFCIADVRDVAVAHIQAMEPQRRCSGRYCLTNSAMSVASILQIVHEHYSDIELPTRQARDFFVRLRTSGDKSARGEAVRYMLGRTPRVSNRRATDMGIMMRPPIQTIVDTVRYFIEHGHLDPPPDSSPVTCILS